MPYARTESGKIQTRIPIEGTDYHLVFQAENVRMTNTGPHATVTIALNTTILDEDTFNLRRHPDRNRLGNGALKSPQFKPELRGRVDLQHELLLFARGLWDFTQGEIVIGKRGGSTERVGPDWLLEPYQLRGAGTILFAPPGRGKSWSALLWAVSVDSGNQALFNVRAGVPVLFINLERSRESVDARLGDVNAVLGLHRERPLLRLDARGRTLSDVWDRADKLKKTEGVEYVVLDSLSRGGFGDLNENQSANRAMDGLNAFGCAWMALGHTPRGDEGHVFGSQMFDAAADIAVQLLTEEKGDLLGVGFRGVKANDVRRPPLTIYALHFDDLGLDSVRRAYGGEFLRVEGAEVRGLEAQLDRYVLEVGRTSATDAADATGIPRTTVIDLFRKSGRFVYLGKEGRKQMFALKAEVTEVSDSPSHLVTNDPASRRRRDDEASSYTSSHENEVLDEPPF